MKCSRGSQEEESEFYYISEELPLPPGHHLLFLLESQQHPYVTRSTHEAEKELNVGSNRKVLSLNLTYSINYHCVNLVEFNRTISLRFACTPAVLDTDRNHLKPVVDCWPIWGQQHVNVEREKILPFQARKWLAFQF